MSKPIITVVSVNYNTSVFQELMMYSLTNLTFNSFKVIYCDNGSGRENLAMLNNLSNNYANLMVIYRNQTKDASIEHATALDKMIKMVDTEYTVVMDSDCTFLMKNWDEYLLNEIDNKIKIVGSSSPQNRAGTRIGGGDFPLPFATLFETETYKKLNISCMPGNVVKGEDTCWEWKTKFLNNGFSGKTFLTKNTRDSKDGLFGTLIGVEEYYTDSGELIASHFGRGASGGLAKYLSGKNSKVQNLLQTINPKIGGIFAKLKGEHEMKLWLKKCYRIIDCQT